MANNFRITPKIEHTIREWCEDELSRRINEGRKRILIEADFGFGKTGFLESFCARYPSRVIGTHSCQLAKSESWMASTFVKSLDDQLRSSPKLWLRAHVEKPLSWGEADNHAARFSALFPSHPEPGATEPKFLLIDALDEIDQRQFVDDDTTLLKMLFDPGEGGATIPKWLTVIATAQPRFRAYINEKSRYNIDDWTVVEFSKQDDRQDVDLLRTVEEQLPQGPLSDGLSRKEFIAAVVEKLEGDFRYLRLLLTDLEGRDLSRATLDVIPKGIYAHYDKTFRFLFGEPTEAAWKNAASLLAVLQAVNSADKSLLSACATLPEEDCVALLHRMVSFVNETDSKWRIEHSSINAWLDGKSPYRATMADGHRLVADAVTAAYKHKNLNHANSYLVEWGVPHLLEDARSIFANARNGLSEYKERYAQRVDAALDALTRVTSELRIFPEIQDQLPAWRGRLFDQLQWRHQIRPDELPNSEAILTLAIRGCNEIPNLYSVLRVAIDYHFDEFKKRHEDIVKKTQLISGYAMGRALADSLRIAPNSDESHGEQIWDLASRLFHSDDGDLREAGAYALKFIFAGCEVSERDGQFIHTADRDLTLAYRNYVEVCASSDDYNYRMILAELLIELEIAQRRGSHASWDALVPIASFWRKSWEYHDTDFAELFGVLVWNSKGDDHQPVALSSRTITSEIKSLPEGPAKACANRIKGRIQIVVGRLQEAFATRQQLLSAEWPTRAMKKCLECYRKTEELMPLLAGIDEALQSKQFTQQQIKEFLWPFVLHPVWEVTEAAASVAAEVREARKDDIDAILEGWADNRLYWQARYAAVDAAHDSRHRDRGELFRKFVIGKGLYKDKVRRVRFISAEDLFLASNDCEDDLPTRKPNEKELTRITRRPLVFLADFKTPLKYWIRRADDCTLIDELFQFLQHVSTGAKLNRSKWFHEECHRLLDDWLAAPDVAERIFPASVKDIEATLHANFLNDIHGKKHPELEADAGRNNDGGLGGVANEATASLKPPHFQPRQVRPVQKP